MEKVMYSPVGMTPAMRELFKFHEKIWREDHPERSDVTDFDIAKAFIKLASERGLTRLVKNADGDLVWEPTRRLFRELGDLPVSSLEQQAEEFVEPEKAEEDQTSVQIKVPKELVRDVDWMTAELLDHADKMERAIEVFQALRQRAFDLLDAI